MKKKKDLIKTLLDTIKELTTAKSHPLTKSIPSYVVDSASYSDLNSPTSIEKPESLSEQLTQEVNSNKVDAEEPNFMLLKKIIRKIIIQVVAKTCTPETQ